MTDTLDNFEKTSLVNSNSTKADDFLSLCFELNSQYPQNFNRTLLREFFLKLFDFVITIRKATSDLDHFYDINQLEELLLTLTQQQQELTLKLLWDEISHINPEGLIEKKNLNILKKG
ncbi:MAG: hypothetical protein LBF22_05360 [Deltaproteobacteria bacterium]|jgi:hypothetical protein|nr:hypothetical protein [Deltaproteobacteria bacterium]